MTGSGYLAAVIAIVLAAVLLHNQSTCRTEKVYHVIDGDTFEIRNDRVRIANIDAPERDPTSTEALRQMIEGKKVEVCSQGRDKYGRLLATVRKHGDAGEWMIREGLARRWRD